MSNVTAGAMLLLACPLITGASSGGDPPEPRNTILFVAEVHSSEGVVRCGLFNAKGWLKTPLGEDVVRPGRRTAVCTFYNVGPGTYGISAFHDANSNGKLDTNVVGYPVEDYGASRNARNTFSAPSFEDAKFDYLNGLMWLHAKMH